MAQTVKDLCQLQDNALSIRVSDQVEKLEDLIHAEGDGQAYFNKTHITGGMEELLRESFKRLAGKSTDGIFHLKQAMGGGKTHLMVGLGLLAKNKALRQSLCGSMAHADGFDAVRIAAFNGRNQPTTYFWGEIAEQLGKSEQFRRFWESGPKSPDEQDWLKLFDGDTPSLILLDELPPYFDYYGTQQIGSGTVADIATRAFANMLSAAGKKANVCVVVADLSASYERGTRLIQSALRDARQELGRQEHTITPVNLESNEIYDILRKRLFKKLPDAAQISAIADQFARSLKEASKAKIATRSAEAIADEIAATYPFHPQFKNIIALFKENEEFRQTRGLMELVSRLLKSVWDRQANDVFLIGPQHFDLGISEVREKLADISGMRDVIAKDLWDANFSAHAQTIDQNAGNGHAAQVGALLLTASLSTAVNAVKGLNKEELVSCLVAPLQDPSDYITAFDELEKTAWYLHHNEGRYYFDRQENLTKLLQSLADKAPENKIEEVIRQRLTELYKPQRKVAYTEILPLAKLEEVADKVRRGRVLVIPDPESATSIDVIHKFFEDLSEKNNLLVLTGEPSKMGSLETNARQVFAIKQAETRLPEGSPQRKELDERRSSYELGFTGAIRGMFDKLLIPYHRQGGQPELRSKVLDQAYSHNEAFDGEKLIENTLISTPQKLHTEVEPNFDALRDKAQDHLWPQNVDEARWADMEDRLAQQAAMPWMPPKGLQALKDIACARGLWEDMGNGYITKKPRKKKATVQVVAESSPDDQGRVRLRVTPQHAGPNPRIHYAEDGPVSQESAILKDDQLVTHALRVQFLAVDPSDQHESDTPHTWKNSLKIRFEELEGSPRKIQVHVAPRGSLKYTLDGSEPRNGTPCTGPIPIGPEGARLMVFAEADGLEARDQMILAKEGDDKVAIDLTQPASIQARSGAGKKLDSKAKTFTGLQEIKDRNGELEGVMLTIGSDRQAVNVMYGEVVLQATQLETVLKAILEHPNFGPETPVTLSFKKAHFTSGHDLQKFAEIMGLELAQGEVVQA